MTRDTKGVSSNQMVSNKRHGLITFIGGYSKCSFVISHVILMVCSVIIFFNVVAIGSACKYVIIPILNVFLWVAHFLKVYVNMSVTPCNCLSVIALLCEA